MSTTAWSQQLGATLRARRVLASVGMPVDVELVKAADSVNEVWFAGADVLRISTNPSLRRLEHEASVVRMLPSAARAPRTLSMGRGETGEWAFIERAPGVPLSRAWTAMGDAARRSAVAQLADALRAVHEVVPPVGFSAPFLHQDSLECPHQLPAGRMLDLLDRARLLPLVQASVIDAAEALVRAGMGALDPPSAAQHLIHGDLHLENVLWDGARVSALLDFEWSRPGPIDLDLDVLLRFLAEPDAHVQADYAATVSWRDFVEVPSMLRASYPELFAHPRLTERLTLYGLSYDVRALLVDPPRKPPDQLPHHHAYNRIRWTVSGRTHLTRFGL